MDPQRHTLRGLLCFTRISYPADPLGMVSVENPNGYTDKMRKIKSRTISSDPVYSPMESSTWSVCQETHFLAAPCQDSPKVVTFEV